VVDVSGACAAPAGITCGVTHSLVSTHTHTHTRATQESARTRTEGSKSAGECVERARNWAAAMRNGAGNTAAGLRSFYRSPWACTNTGQGAQLWE
jgi:hypothetical protein